MKERKKGFNLAFTAVVGILCLILIFLPTGFENPETTNITEREKARVLEVDNSDIQQFNVVRVGSQYLTIKIISGRFKGDTVKTENVLQGQMRRDVIFEKGDLINAVIKPGPEGESIESVAADNIYRINIALILFGLFALFLVGFAKWTGAKALLSFVFTALSIWKILIPALLRGFDPIWVSFGIVSLTTFVIVMLISGFTRKGVTALGGAVAGIGVTTLLAVIFGHFFRIPGTVQEYSETILYAGFIDLDLNKMFIAGIFIAAAGAVMDVAMDIAAAQNEVSEKKPEITRKELILSGFKVAYPVIGTMTTTLLFAYSSSYLFLFMMFMAKGTPPEIIFNINFIAAEILNTLVGSFGLVLVAPTTAIIGGFVYTRKANISSGSPGSE